MADSSSHSISTELSSTLSSPEPPSFLTVTSAARFDGWESFENHVYSRLIEAKKAKEYHEFEFIEIPDSWARDLITNLDEEIPLKSSKYYPSFLKKLEETVPPPTRITYNKTTATLRLRVMPTAIHECVLPWMIEELALLWESGSLTRAEYFSLRCVGPQTLTLPSGLFAGSVKQPDCFIRPRGYTLPTFAIETGYSESMPRLRVDKDLLLVGGNPAIKAVMIVKWAKLSGGRVRGELEIWRRNAQGPSLSQKEIIFPVPITTTPATPQLLRLRRDDLFGPALLPGRNPTDILTLDLQRLRISAIEALNDMGLTPA